MYQNNDRTVPHQLPHLLRPLLQEQDSQFVRDVNSNRRFEDTAILLTATIYKLTRCHIKPKTPHTLKNTSSKNSNLTNTRFLRPLTLTPLTWKIWWAPNNTSKWQIRFNSEFRGLNWTYKKKYKCVWRHIFYLLYTAVHCHGYKISKQQTRYSVRMDLYSFLHCNARPYPCLTTENWFLQGIAQSIQWLRHRPSSRFLLRIFLAQEKLILFVLSRTYIDSANHRTYYWPGKGRFAQGAIRQGREGDHLHIDKLSRLRISGGTLLLHHTSFRAELHIDIYFTIYEKRNIVHRTVIIQFRLIHTITFHFCESNFNIIPTFMPRFLTVCVIVRFVVETVTKTGISLFFLFR